MPPEDTAVAKSPLDKPLGELTEDDISQLTREDCRRYLKQKGMRRPSWNKSQAIQQVISLKMLLETTLDSDAAGSRKRLCIPRPRLDTVKNDTMNNPSKATSIDDDVSESAEELLSCPRKDAEKADVSSSRMPVEDNASFPPRCTGSSSVPVGQMTIFYCGRVNVYDNVPADKAQALMHYAASPHAFPHEAMFDQSLATQSTCHLQDMSTKSCPDSAVLLSPNVQSVRMTETVRVHGEEYKLPDDNPDGPTSRKASVQRYLEKRKDRFKSKKKVGTTPTTGLDIYLPHHMGHHIPNEQSSRSDPCSPQQLRPPQTPIRCSSMEDTSARNASLNFAIKDRDLNR